MNSIDPIFFEKLLIKFLFHDTDVRERVMPFLSVNIFDNFENKEVAKHILSFQKKFDRFPTFPDLKLIIEQKEVYDRLFEIVNLDVSEYSNEHLLSVIEEFFKKKLAWTVVASVAESLKNDSMDKVSKAPDELREAIAFGFDTEIGLDFFNEMERMYNNLHDVDSVVSSGLKTLDKKIKRGFHEKSLTLFLAETNLGKTLIQCSFAVNAVLQNKNVLYITLEMSENKISERLIANLFDVNINDLTMLTKDKFKNKFESVKSKIQQHFIVKEYPTKSINANNIRNLVKELKLKKNFVPDIIFIDYIGIMNPIHTRKDENSYTELKRVSEETRGLAVELECPIVSAIQTNRKGYSSSDIDLTDVADSIGTAATADIIIGVTQSEEFRDSGKFSFIILKNRYGINRQKLVVSVDYNKMRVLDNVDSTKDQPKESTKTINNVDSAASSVKTELKKDNIERKKKIIDFS